jgi:hypothetical protein
MESMVEGFGVLQQCIEYADIEDEVQRIHSTAPRCGAQGVHGGTCHTSRVCAHHDTLSAVLLRWSGGDRGGGERWM